MHPLRLLGILLILHAIGLVGFVVIRDNQINLAQGEPHSSVVEQGNLSISSDPAGGLSSPNEVFERYERSKFSSRTLMLAIAAGLCVVGVICTATVSGRE